MVSKKCILSGAFIEAFSSWVFLSNEKKACVITTNLILYLLCDSVY
jgi:hypothetical protein